MVFEPHPQQERLDAVADDLTRPTRARTARRPASRNEYHQYRVLKPPPESVTEGPIAPAFGQPGGGTQHYCDDRLECYLKNGYLEGVGP